MFRCLSTINGLLCTYSRFAPCFRQHNQAFITIKAIEKVAKEGEYNGNRILAKLSALIGDNPWRGEFKLSTLSLYLHQQRQAIRNLFDYDNDFTQFVRLATQFYERYVHKSVYPWNDDSAGMNPQLDRISVSVKEKHRTTAHQSLIYRRQIHTPTAVNFEEANKKAKIVATATSLSMPPPIGPIVGRGAAEIMTYERLTPDRFTHRKHGE